MSIVDRSAFENVFQKYTRLMYEENDVQLLELRDDVSMDSARLKIKKSRFQQAVKTEKKPFPTAIAASLFLY